MLEDRCHLLDIQLAANMAKTNDSIDQAGFDSYVATQSQIRNLEYLVTDYHHKINLVHEAINSAILFEPEKEEQIRELYAPRLIHLNNKMNEKVILF